MLHTILQIIAFQALFLLIYDLFLKRETFFNYNRAYLLITAVLSFILPFLKLPELRNIATKDMVINLPEVFIGTTVPSSYEIQIAEQAGIIIEQPQTPIWQSIVIAGIVIASFLFLFKIAKLYWLKHKNPKRWKGNVLIVKLLKSTAAFSFFNTIFLGEQIPESQKTTIFKHELVHIKELHTADLLFFELLRIVCWFNPLIYIYQHRIKELHEYIADAKAVKENGKSDYYQSLLHQVFDVNQVSFTNTFFKSSLIKKRIAMLQKSKSKQRNLIKYALLIPIVLGMLIYTSTEVRAQQKTSQQTAVDQELTDEELAKKYYDDYLEMEKNGSTFFEISEYAGISKNKPEKYILSRAEFSKLRAYFQYIADGMIQRKSEKGTLEDADFDTAELMKQTGSYSEYREWKKTDEAKERWQLNTQDGILKLVVQDFGKMTEAEQKEFDGLLKQLESDNYFTKLIVADETSTLVIDSFRNPDADGKDTNEVVEIVEVPFSVVEKVPTPIECKDLESNKERKDCMSTYINKHIGTNFNMSLSDSLNPGRKRIFVQFKIDTEGYVKNIKARGPSEILEEEAVRVIRSLPQFTPGKQKGKLVTVPYTLPIVFQAAGKTDASKSLNEDHNKPQSNTTTILINRKNQFLINDELASFKSLTELLKTIPENKKHTVQLAYDKETSKTIIKDVLDLIKQYPSITVKKSVNGPRSGYDNRN